jgi:hypothetical protein
MRIKKIFFAFLAKITWPSKEEIEKLVWEKPIYILCKELGVSDNAVIKHCKKFDISRPPVGYWLKITQGTQMYSGES